MKVQVFVTGTHVIVQDAARQREEIRTVGESGWRYAMAEALSSTLSAAPIGRFSIVSGSVLLGLAHTRLGVARVEGAKGLAAYVPAWCEQVLHVKASDQVVRWRESADRQSVLVSCIDRHLAEEVVGAFAQAKIKLASCLPAVLAVFDRAADVASRAGTIVWTEGSKPGDRAAAVQLLHVESREIRGAWRGWIQSPDPVQADVELDAAIARFGAHHGVGANSPVRRGHWPAESLA